MEIDSFSAMENITTWTLLEKFVKALLNILPPNVQASSQTLKKIIPTLQEKVGTVHLI